MENECELHLLGILLKIQSHDNEMNKKKRNATKILQQNLVQKSMNSDLRINYTAFITISVCLLNF